MITNYHVIGDAKNVHVSFSNSDSMRAEVIGEDPATDVALLGAGELARAQGARSGRFRHRRGRRPGGGDREPARLRPEHHARNRQRPPPLAHVAGGTADRPRGRPEEQAIAEEPRYLAFVEYAGRLGAAPGRQRAARPRRHARRGDVLPRARRRAAVAARRARALGQLAVPLGRGDRARLQPRRDPRPAAAERRAAGRSATSREWEAFVDRLVALGLIPDYTMLWWDMRPHPRFGTLEIRMPDQPTSLARDRSRWSALLQALCEPRRDAAPATTRRRGRSTSRTAGRRSGPGSTPSSLHPDGDGMARAGSSRRSSPSSWSVGVDTTRTEAERQLEVGRADGLEALCGRTRRADATLGQCPSRPTRSRSPASAASAASAGSRRPARGGGPRRRPPTSWARSR